MVLTLEIIAPSSSTGAAARQTFTTSGGTIGREAGNSWVLPHPKVSGRHAVISYANGGFYIEDRSRNGVCLNSSRNRLARGEPQPLSSGDRLFIDPYEIRVSVEGDDQRSRGLEASSDADPFGLLGDAVDDPFAPQPQPQPVRRASVEPLPPNRVPSFDGAEPASREELDPLALLDLHEDRPAPRKPAP
ncbi:MAG TPA: FHA domain-containing protein, partial [Vicinamibacterales bacterium]|nr:FHA domain-containing protein [Vicinamibacterales bacterium]